MPVPDFEPVLNFWFGTLTEGYADTAHRKRWFSGGSAFDAQLTQNFANLVVAAMAGELDTWIAGPHSTLAYVLVCDQLTRNIHRGTAAAFAGDQRALDAARRAVATGQDLALAPDERAFLYMPFEHSESLVDQHTCVGLFSELHDAAAPDKQPVSASFLRFAQQHRDIIREFGRFPHRNALLGRTSTAAEERFIATGPGFGQTRG